MLQYLVICFPFFCITQFPHWKAALMVLNSACFKKNLFIFRPHWIFVAWIFQLQLWVSSSLQGTGFSLWWLLLLWSTCCRVPGLQYLWCMGLVTPHRIFLNQGIEPVSPVLAGRFSTTGPPEKFQMVHS